MFSSEGSTVKESNRSQRADCPNRVVEMSSRLSRLDSIATPAQFDLGDMGSSGRPLTPALSADTFCFDTSAQAA